MHDLVARARAWPGWRRYAPAAGSVAAHVLVLMGALGMAAATSPRARPPPPEPQVTVQLITEVAPPPPMRQPPPAPPASSAVQPETEQLPAAPQRRREQRSRAPAPTPAPTAPTPGAQALNDEDAIAVPLGPSNVPLGLKPLLQTNPCSQRLERMRGDCDKRWAKLAAEGALVVSPTLERLAQLYPDFELEPDDPLNAKIPVPRGVRSMTEPGVMPGGPGGGFGPESETSRLPPKNWQHQDPAFGSYKPSWLP